jgi:hypothetical protein
MSGQRLSHGDFVELVDCNKRGYVVKCSNDGPECEINYVDPNNKTAWGNPRRITVEKSKLKLLWKQKEMKVLNVPAYLSKSYPVHGVAASFPNR